MNDLKHLGAFVTNTPVTKADTAVYGQTYVDVVSNIAKLTPPSQLWIKELNRFFAKYGYLSEKQVDTIYAIYNKQLKGEAK